MVWRRMRVTRKTGGRGGVSYTVTIPEEIYQAMGRPEEVLVSYSDGVMHVKPARRIQEAGTQLGDSRARTMLDALTRMGRERLLLDTIIRRLEEASPRILAVDCREGAIAYESKSSVEAMNFEPGLCGDLATLLAELLAVDPEELAGMLAERGRLLMEVTPGRVVVYRL